LSKKQAGFPKVIIIERITRRLNACKQPKRAGTLMSDYSELAASYISNRLTGKNNSMGKRLKEASPQAWRCDIM
jgi:hypothetical protein